MYRCIDVDKKLLHTHIHIRIYTFVCLCVRVSTACRACNPSKASWQTWEFPWRASMRAKAWPNSSLRQCHPHPRCAAERRRNFHQCSGVFTPEGFFIASETVGLLGWSCFVGNRSLLSVLNTFLVIDSAHTHTHSLNNVPEMFPCWN